MTANEIIHLYHQFLDTHNNVEPNAVWADITMKNPKGYDTPNFCGYILFVTDEQIDEYYDNDKIPFGLQESDFIYMTNSVITLCKELNNNDTDFYVTDINFDVKLNF